jgi:hypothetical protein
MATKASNNNLDRAHFRNAAKHFPKAKNWHKPTVNDFLNLGIIQVSTLVEHVIAHIGGNTVTSTDSEDISNGIDVKCATVRTHGHGKSYSAPVTNIFGKTGGLAIQVYERKQKKFYYFCVPRAAYEHVPRKSNIDIPFEMDGTPRRVPRGRVKQNWWNYETTSFKNLGKFNG